MNFDHIHPIILSCPFSSRRVVAPSLSLLFLTWYERDHELYRGCGDVPCHLECLRIERH